MMSSWIGEQVFVQTTGPDPQTYRGYLVKEDYWSIFLESAIDEKTEVEYSSIRIDVPPPELLITPLYARRRDLHL